MHPNRTILCVCRRCGDTFLILPSDARRGRGGYCSRECYQQARIDGARPASERLWEQVDRSGGPDACWPWLGATSGKGYGLLRVGSKRDGTAANVSTHRLAWILTRGPIPDETPCVLHKCDNPPCCNSAHHFLGTKADNTADMMAKGRNGYWARSGALNPMTKVRSTDVVGMRTRYEAGESAKALAVALGLRYKTVWRIVTGRSRIAG